MPDEILQHRMARGVIVEGASSILASEWTDVLTRLDAVEDVAGTYMPWVPSSTQYMTPVTHGLGDKNQQTTGTIQAQRVYWTPLWSPASLAVDRMAVYISPGGSAGGILTLGIYDRNGVLQRSFGNVTTDTSGWKIATLSGGQTEQIDAGLLWLAVRSNNVAIGMVHFQCDRYLFQDSAFVGMTTPNAPAATSLPATMSPAGYTSVVPHVALGVA